MEYVEEWRQGRKGKELLSRLKGELKGKLNENICRFIMEFVIGENSISRRKRIGRKEKKRGKRKG